MVCVSVVCRVCVCTSERAEDAVQLLGVAVDAPQGVLGDGLGCIDSVQQVVELLEK